LAEYGATTEHDQTDNRYCRCRFIQTSPHDYPPFLNTGERYFGCSGFVKDMHQSMCSNRTRAKARDYKIDPVWIPQSELASIIQVRLPLMESIQGIMINLNTSEPSAIESLD